MTTLTATLVPSADPRPVQIVLDDVAAGVAYDVKGSTADGSSWSVPGGVGVSAGAQVVLVDNRSALNVPVTYRVTVNGTVTSASPVTVSYDGRCVLQSLNGQTVAAVRLHDNGDPREVTIHSQAVDVPGRSRPPVRYATGGFGTGAIEVTTRAADTAALRDILLAGGPMVVRTDGTTPLERAVDIVMVTGARSVIATSTQYGDSRRWSLPVLYVDDPEPSTPLAAWTWADFDEVMVTRTWADFDALFAASTWDDFDTYPWGQL